MNDPTLVRWQKENIFLFPQTHLLLETIKTATGKYQTAIFECDDIGRLRHAGIQYSQYYIEENDALSSHEKIIAELKKIQEGPVILSIADVYSKIDALGIIPLHVGPKFVSFVPVRGGNAAIGFREPVHRG
jgi:hypothetical protein